MVAPEKHTPSQPKSFANPSHTPHLSLTGVVGEFGAMCEAGGALRTSLPAEHALAVGNRAHGGFSLGQGEQQENQQEQGEHLTTGGRLGSREPLWRDSGGRAARTEASHRGSQRLFHQGSRLAGGGAGAGGGGR